MVGHYRMPAEWECQAAIWLAWPHQKNDWPGKFAPIPWVYTEIIRCIAAGQTVRLIVKNEREQERAAEALALAGANPDNVEYYIIPTNRVWVRDSGPIFVYQGKKKVMLDWRFNAWAKYPNWRLDNKVPPMIEIHLGYSRLEPVRHKRRVVLEGGAIDVNGKGLLLTTEECLLSEAQQCRNPGFTRADYEAVFAEYLGIEQTIWLGQGITGDDTHGHVDDLARFVGENTIVTVVEPDAKDDNHAPLKDNLKRLKQARNLDGKPLEVIELPMPKPIYFEGVRLPASYANFLICNKVVLVPTFNDPADRVALGILAEIFKDREVIGIHATDLVWGFGTLHCLSQQEVE